MTLSDCPVQEPHGPHKVAFDMPDGGVYRERCGGYLSPEEVEEIRRAKARAAAIREVKAQAKYIRKMSRLTARNAGRFGIFS